MWCAGDNRGLDQYGCRHEPQLELPKENNIFYKVSKKKKKKIGCFFLVFKKSWFRDDFF
jgi:hypothetical protein